MPDPVGPCAGGDVIATDEIVPSLAEMAEPPSRLGPAVALGLMAIGALTISFCWIVLILLSC